MKTPTIKKLNLIIFGESFEYDDATPLMFSSKNIKNIIKHVEDILKDIKKNKEQSQYVSTYYSHHCKNCGRKSVHTSDCMYDSW